MSPFLLFLVAAVVALVATLRVVTCRHPIHALLYFVVSLLAVAVIFLVLGAPFVAALEIVVYAGAIMVLFIFAVMLFQSSEDDELRPRPVEFVGPTLLSAVLFALVAGILGGALGPDAAIAGRVGPKAVAATLLGPYLLAVELASMLLLAGLIAAHHLARDLSGPGSPAEDPP